MTSKRRYRTLIGALSGILVLGWWTGAFAGWITGSPSKCQIIDNGMWNPAVSPPLGSSNSWVGRPVGNSSSYALEVNCGVDESTALPVDDGVTMTTVEVDLENANPSVSAFFQICSADWFSGGAESCDAPVYSSGTGNQALVQTPLTNWVNNSGNAHYIYVSIPQSSSATRGLDGYWIHN